MVMKAVIEQLCKRKDSSPMVKKNSKGEYEITLDSEEVVNLNQLIQSKATNYSLIHLEEEVANSGYQSLMNSESGKNYLSPDIDGKVFASKSEYIDRARTYTPNEVASLEKCSFGELAAMNIYTTNAYPYFTALGRGEINFPTEMAAESRCEFLEGLLISHALAASGINKASRYHPENISIREINTTKDENLNIDLPFRQVIESATVEKFNDLAASPVITYDAVTSQALDDVASEFEFSKRGSVAGKPTEGKFADITIVVENPYGAIISGISKYPDEKEIVTTPGNQLEVTAMAEGKRDESNKKTCILRAHPCVSPDNRPENTFKNYKTKLQELKADEATPEPNFTPGQG
eukprot:TRINITY_DN42181_c0_g1_i1.p1 TRINITY_DN42181_c0_g1~~TRINITY_DN42181_c0_g1_i1.p1  ORF type:complete len:397 (+),score=36.54 TRINITY_DN42181_c0_g1_i1:143-1192(+)